MPDEPFTADELAAGAEAVRALLAEHHGAPQSWDSIVAAALRAVLPDHDARVRADERARVAEEIAQTIEAMEPDDRDAVMAARYAAAAIARAHATPPTTEGDHRD